MTLNELLSRLLNYPRDCVVKHGFAEPFSNRGNYTTISFAPASDVTIGEMIKHAESAIGATFTGYKGGEFTMDEHTEVHIGEFDESGEQITDFHFYYWDCECGR